MDGPSRRSRKGAVQRAKKARRDLGLFLEEEDRGEEILDELGYAHDEVMKLAELGVIRVADQNTATIK